MAKSNSNESVSVSFHYLQKEIINENEERKVNPFTQDEFDKLVNKIKNAQVPNLKDSQDIDLIKSGQLIHFERFEWRDKRCFFALHHSAYWGHSFENSDKGDISAESLNMRPFQFLMYLSDDGKIYIGCQYLGNYGSYSEIKRYIMRTLELGGKVSAYSFRSDEEEFTNVTPVEVKIDLYSQGNKIDDKNTLGSGTAVAFKKDAKDDTFELSVKDKILALIGKPDAQMKKNIAELLNEKGFFKVADEDIMDCKVVVRRSGGGTKTVYIFENGKFATKFQLEVVLESNGHPLQADTRNAMYDKLADKIIARTTDG